jgi:hypothetical protein
MRLGMPWRADAPVVDNEINVLKQWIGDIRLSKLLDADGTLDLAS